MNQANPFFTLDRVNGIIIGEYSVRVALVSPNGNVQRETHIGIHDNPKDWGIAEKSSLLSVKCGDGKPLSHYADLVGQFMATENGTLGFGINTMHSLLPILFLTGCIAMVSTVVIGMVWIAWDSFKG